jgi:CRP-like cAMP-binding protein
LRANCVSWLTVPRRAKRAASLLEAASLSTHDLFKGLPAECLSALEANSEVREFRSGHVFFRAGENGQRLFLVETGQVQTFRSSGTRKLVIAELKPPAIFGEMAFVGQCMYHCSAQTTEASRIRIIERAELEKLLAEHAILTRRLLDLVSQRFVRVLVDLEATSFRHLLPRVAALLLERAQGDAIENLTHQEMAEQLHVYRESVTTALGELRKAGIIAVNRKRIRLLNRTRLERAARE